MQTPDPSIFDVIPASWRVPVGIAVILLPYITRAFYAVKQGGGVRGLWRAIWFGTNTPK